MSLLLSNTKPGLHGTWAASSSFGVSDFCLGKNIPHELFRTYGSNVYCSKIEIYWVQRLTYSILLALCLAHASHLALITYDCPKKLLWCFFASQKKRSFAALSWKQSFPKLGIQRGQGNPAQTVALLPKPGDRTGLSGSESSWGKQGQAKGKDSRKGWGQLWLRSWNVFCFN